MTPSTRNGGKVKRLLSFFLLLSVPALAQYTVPTTVEDARQNSVYKYPEGGILAHDKTDPKKVYPVPRASNGGLLVGQDSAPSGTSATVTPTGSPIIRTIPAFTPTPTTVTLTQTPFVPTLQNAVTAATSSEAWFDTWSCGGHPFTLTFTGTFTSMTYNVYVENGTSAPAAGATNGVLLTTSPITVTAPTYYSIDPSWRYISAALTVVTGGNCTVKGYCNNYNSRSELEHFLYLADRIPPSEPWDWTISPSEPRWWQRLFSWIPSHHGA